MVQVKMFEGLLNSHASQEQSEDLVNAWLREHADIEVLDIKVQVLQAANGCIYCCHTVIYKQEKTE